MTVNNTAVITANSQDYIRLSRALAMQALTGKTLLDMHNVQKLGEAQLEQICSGGVA